MILKFDSRGGVDPKGTAKWSTTLSWFESGRFIPITVTVFYAYPNMEVLDVDVDFAKSEVDVSGFKIESLIAATALEEFSTQRERLKREHNTKRDTGKNQIASKGIDPFFQ